VGRRSTRRKGRLCKVTSFNRVPKKTAHSRTQSPIDCYSSIDRRKDLVEGRKGQPSPGLFSVRFHCWCPAGTLFSTPCFDQGVPTLYIGCLCLCFSSLPSSAFLHPSLSLSSCFYLHPHPISSPPLLTSHYHFCILLVLLYIRLFIFPLFYFLYATPFLSAVYSRRLFSALAIKFLFTGPLTLFPPVLRALHRFSFCRLYLHPSASLHANQPTNNFVSILGGARTTWTIPGFLFYCVDCLKIVA